MKRKNKKIRYYGGKPSNTGYLFGVSPSLRGLQYLKATDMNSLAGALQNTMIPRAIGSLAPSIANAGNVFTNYASRGANLIGTKITEAQALSLAGREIFGLQAGSEITQDTVNGLSNNALKSIGGSRAGLNTLGYVAAAAGALQGGIGLAQDIGNWSNDRVTANDLMNASGRSTGVINGRTYDRFESFDKHGMNKYVNLLNTRDTISTIGNAASIGGAAGSLFGPIGWGVGTGIGALLGGIGSIFGGDSRDRAYEKAIRNWEATRNGYNTLEEAVAANLGVGDEFYDGRTYGAKRGKSSHGGMYGNKSDSDFGVVETSEGKKVGPKRSNVSVGESIVDFEKERAHYISGKSSERGKDTKNSVEAPGTPGFIPGFVLNPMTGNYIADDAAPYVQLIEKVNQIEDYAKRKSSGETQQLMLQEAQKAKQEPLQRLKELEGIQDYVNNIQDMRNYKCGKHSYATGKSFLEGVTEFAPYAVLAMFPLAELAHYKGTPIRVQDTYAANQYIEDAAKAMKSARYDSYNQHQQVNDEKRQALYDIMHSAVSPAAKIGLLAKLHAQSSGQHSAIEANAQNEKNKQFVDYANFIANAGSKDSQMRNAANESMAQRMITAQGAIDKGVGSALIGASKIPQAISKHMNQLKMFDQSTGIYKRMARIYDAQAEKEEYELEQRRNEDAERVANAKKYPATNYMLNPDVYQIPAYQSVLPRFHMFDQSQFTDNSGGYPVFKYPSYSVR